jgi:hypothetical protein
LCKGKGHDDRQCPQRCEACSRDVHLAKDCPVECFQCHGRGHVKRDCPNADDSTSAAV